MLFVLNKLDSLYICCISYFWVLKILKCLLFESELGVFSPY